MRVGDVFALQRRLLAAQVHGREQAAQRQQHEQQAQDQEAAAATHGRHFNWAASLVDCEAANNKAPDLPGPWSDSCGAG